MYVVMFQGAKVELHLVGLTESIQQAENFAAKKLSRLEPGLSLVIVEGEPEEEGYTNVVDYIVDSMEDGHIIRSVYDVAAKFVAIPENDTRFRPIKTVMCC